MTASRPVLPDAERVGRVRWGMCCYCLGPMVDGDRHEVRAVDGSEVCVITHRAPGSSVGGAR